MQAKILHALQEARSLAETRDLLLELFRAERSGGLTDIGYVSGMISSDGPEHIQRNRERLRAITEEVRQRENVAIFSAVDVFNDQLFPKLEVLGYPNEDWIQFWREILDTPERFVTSVFMTPRWEESRGARDEHEVALRMGITIYYTEGAFVPPTSNIRG